MASPVRCEKHGLHDSQLCCTHLGEAVYRGAALLRYDEYLFDIEGDGRAVLNHFICADCAEQFGLSTSIPITAEVWESEEKFPYVSPACSACFSEWSAQEMKPS